MVRITENGEILTGRIVETEAYPGLTDVASHSFRGRTERNQAMFMPAGTCYVYYIYGRQNCVNVSSKDEAGAVLIRAVEPIEGHSIMLKNRNKKVDASLAQSLKSIKDVSNGPAKLCQALNITKDEFNCQPLTFSRSTETGSEISVVPKLFMAKTEEGNIPEDSIVVSTRVGIDGCGKEAAALPLRYFIKRNFYVSVVKKTDSIG